MSRRKQESAASRPDAATARVRRAIRAAGLLERGDRVLLGVSGGPDSLALLHALAVGGAAAGVEVVVAHLHHQLRGAEAELDAAFVASTAAGWGVPALVGRDDVRARARGGRLSLETAGREARYAFFRWAAAEAECGKVALAHTADDQAETVLLNLLRGAGLEGLAGIPPRRPLHPGPDAPEVVRPLLRVRRAEVLRYGEENDLQPRDDVENRSLEYARNRVRLRLIPLLEAEFNPRARERLVNLAELAAEENRYLEQQAAALRRDLERPLAGGAALDAAGLAAAPPALARRVVRQVVRALAGAEVELDRALVERLLALARGKRTTGLPLRGAPLRAALRGGLLVLEPSPARPAPPLRERRALPVPGAAALPGVGQVTAERVPRPAELDAGPRGGYLDPGALVGGLTLRAWQPGDRFHPLGAPGERKLGDVFTDRKIPRDRRARLPVVTDGERLVWVAGVGVSEAARVPAGAEEVVRLRWEPGS